MVTVTNYAVRKTKDDRTFITLELTGGVELVQSQETGNFYATVRKCSIPTTFDEETAKAIVGTKMEGEVVKIATEAYDFVNPDSGEVLTLAHSWEYRPTTATQAIMATV